MAQVIIWIICSVLACATLLGIVWSLQEVLEDEVDEWDGKGFVDEDHPGY